MIGFYLLLKSIGKLEPSYVLVSFLFKEQLFLVNGRSIVFVRGGLLNNPCPKFGIGIPYAPICPSFHGVFVHGCGLRSFICSSFTWVSH